MFNSDCLEIKEPKVGQSKFKIINLSKVADDAYIGVAFNHARSAVYFLLPKNIPKILITNCEAFYSKFVEYSWARFKVANYFRNHSRIKYNFLLQHLFLSENILGGFFGVCILLTSSKLNDKFNDDQAYFSTHKNPDIIELKFAA